MKRCVVLLGAALFDAVCSASGLLLTPEQSVAVAQRVRTESDAHVWWTNLTARLATDRVEASRVPLKGGQWWNYYFCKDCNRQLVTESDARHVCPKCARAYSGWPYDDAALLLRHMKLASDVRDAGLAFLVSHDGRFAAYVRDVLLSYAERYPKYELHDNWKGKSHLGGIVTSQALDDATWLIGIASGYDAVADTLATEERERIVGVVLRPEAELLMGADRGSTRVGNHECWHAAAVGLVGYATGDAALVSHAEKSSAGLDFQLEKGVLADGAWFELAWGYHFYTIQALMPFYRAKRNRGGNVPEALHRMFRAPIAQVMSGWRLPANGDTGAIPFAPGSYGDLYAEAASWWTEDRALAAWAAAAPKGTAGPALWGRRTGMERFPRIASKCAEGSGVAALRIGQMPDGSPRTSLAFDFGPHGGWHGHHDKLSYELWHEGEVVADDPGCGNYAQPLHFAWFRQTAAHNTLAVDGRSQVETTGRLLSFHAGKDRSSAVATAEIAKGVTATRAVALEDGLVFDLMWTESGEEHTYDWFFHARGEFSPSLALASVGSVNRVVREKLRPECWDGSESYSWLENPQVGVHEGNWSATWRDGARKISLVQTSAEGALHAGLGWGKGGQVRQTVVFNRVKGRSVAFGTVLALDGQTVENVKVKRDGSGYILSASVDGVQKTFSTAASRIPAFERKTPEQIEAAALSAEKRNRNRQSRLKDRCKLTDYSSRVAVVGGTNIWTSALRQALAEHEIVEIPARQEPYHVDASIIVPSDRRIEAKGATIVAVPSMETAMLIGERIVDGSEHPVPDDLTRAENIAIVGGRWVDSHDRMMYDWHDERWLWTTGRWSDGGRMGGYGGRPFWGVRAMMYFGNITGLTIEGATFAGSSSFAVQIDLADDVVCEDLTFEHCHADCLHFNGRVRNVLVRNIVGEGGDDFLALNFWDWTNCGLNFGPGDTIMVENLKVTGGAAWLRILPGTYGYADGSTVDCAARNILIRGVRGISEFKCYPQGQPQRPGRFDRSLAALGTGGSIWFEDVEIPDVPSVHGDPLHSAPFEICANLADFHIRNVRDNRTGTAVRHMVNVGPKSLRGKVAGVEYELFEPRFGCVVEELTIEDVRYLSGSPAEEVHLLSIDGRKGMVGCLVH